MNRLRVLLVAALLVLPMLAGLGISPAAAQRSGIYDVRGTNPDGSEYTGSLVLQQVGATTFRLTWSVAQNTIEGMGMISGLTFAVVFQLGEQTAMGMYELKADGEMTGTWTVVGSQAIGTETIRPR
ncbi:hypothetical protein [Rhodovarius lipocyclicus]|uniref:hypothetical protein n=1 Tax=Rhodovarius lipocyclicus TaxID=268410 RepID=UPI00135864AB|nr:hypothetical protein [Rhodovarius lipocyclicus]